MDNEKNRLLSCLPDRAPNLDCLPRFLRRDRAWGQLVTHTSCQGSRHRDSRPALPPKDAPWHREAARSQLPPQGLTLAQWLYFLPTHPLTFILLPQGTLLSYGSSARQTNPWFYSRGLKALCAHRSAPVYTPHPRNSRHYNITLFTEVAAVVF